MSKDKWGRLLSSRHRPEIHHEDGKPRFHWLERASLALRYVSSCRRYSVDPVVVSVVGGGKEFIPNVSMLTSWQCGKALLAPLDGT